MVKNFYLRYKRHKIFFHLGFPNKKGKQPSILFLHGATGNHHTFDLIIDNLKNNFICLSFDHLGCGDSDGKLEQFTLNDRLAQIKFVLSYLLKLPKVDKNKIIVVAASMGAHTAARLSGISKINSLILRAPASYSQAYEKIKMKPGWLPWNWQKKFWPWQPSSALTALEKFKGNLLIVKSEKDEVVPDKVIDKFYNIGTQAKTRKLVIIKDAPHKISDKPQFNKKFLKVIKEYLKTQEFLN